MFKNLIAAIGLLGLALTSAFAGSVTTVTGPQDPSQLNATLNSLIVSGNTYWNPAGAAFLASNNITANSTVAVTLTSLGPSGLSPTTIVSWLKIRGYVNNSTTPTFFLLPLWGCPTCN